MSVSPPATWLSAAAEATPHAPAVITDSGTVGYRDLAGAAARWGEQLDELVGADRPHVVAVVAAKTVQAVAQLWSAWQSPHTVLLVDPASPPIWDEAQLAAWGVHVLLDGEQATEIEPAAPPATPGHHTWVLTSGTTEAPRPVILTHGNVAAAVAASQRRLGNDASDRWQLALPLHHVGGVSVLWRSAAAGGAVVLDERFDARRTAQRLADGAITISSLVPTMLHRLVAQVDEVSPDLRAILLGGAAAPRSLVAQGLEAGLPILATYGMTETASQVATVAPESAEESLDGVGRPLDGFFVTIDGPDADGVGEVLVDGPAVFPGYVDEPARVGPHRSGDRGRLDAAGRLVITGRADDMIVTGGENVSPAAVEEVLALHPAVERAVVHGIPDAEWGEIVVAVVAAPHGSVTASGMEEFARSRLSSAQLPRRWRIVAELPLLPTGKIDRRAVRAATLSSAR